ncbi:MAG: Smr/MutS family protein [Rhodospirillales bacterium]|nr:Smr/MutS family protein [Rhodospirillales bacterium]
MTKAPKVRTLSDAEAALWLQVTGDVEPLAEFSPTESVTPDPGKPPAPRKKRAPAQAAPTAPRPPADLSHGSAPGLERSAQQKMRRGKVVIEARVDLHGMTQAQAHDVLEDFLFDSQISGRRSVLVITGKGVAGEGILRAAVPKWLNEHRRIVRGFSHAAPKDGGEGALYVLLKKLK